MIKIFNSQTRRIIIGISLLLCLMNIDIAVHAQSRTTGLRIISSRNNTSRPNQVPSIFKPSIPSAPAQTIQLKNNNVIQQGSSNVNKTVRPRVYPAPTSRVNTANLRTAPQKMPITPNTNQSRTIRSRVAASGASNGQPDGVSNYKPDEVIVIFKPGTSLINIDNTHEEVRKRLQAKPGNNRLIEIKPCRFLGPRTYSSLPRSGCPESPVIPKWPIVSGGGCLIDRITTNEDVSNVINEYVRLGDGSPVIKAEPNYYVIPAQIPLIPNDTYFNNQWNMIVTANNINLTVPPLVYGADINATLAWGQAYAPGVLLTPKVVAIVDTGVYTAHPDLAANMVLGWDVFTLSSIVTDIDGHGTSIAGIIGAVGNNLQGIAGVNWTGVKIMPIKALSATSTNADAILGVEYAILNGANIINCSWYLSPLPVSAADVLSLQLSIQKANLAGILVVVAAGNNASNLDDPLYANKYYPPSYPDLNIICVAATSGQNQLGILSNYGAITVDLGAPEGVYTTWSPSATIGNGLFYYGVQGTSIAAPHVAGAAALIWAMFPNLGYLDVKDAIMLSVEPNLSLTGKTVSGGQLDLNGAVNKGRAISLLRPPVI